MRPSKFSSVGSLGPDAEPNAVTQDEVPEVSPILSDTLKATAEWLKFAEAKNGGLIAVNLAVIVASQKMYGPGFVGWACVSAVIFSGFSILVSLISLVPEIGWPFPGRSEKKTSSDNLLFYGDVAKYSTDEYVGELAKLFEGPLIKVDQWTAHQIAVLSKLAVRKYHYFSTACMLTICGVATPLVAAVIFCAREPKLR